VEALLRKASSEKIAAARGGGVGRTQSVPSLSSFDTTGLHDSAADASGSYSAANDLRNAFVSHSSGTPNNEGLVLSLQELQKRPLPPALNKASLEAYLSDEEFLSALGMPRDQFYSLRTWKQTQVKKKAGLL